MKNKINTPTSRGHKRLCSRQWKCLLWGLCELSSGVLLLALQVNHCWNTISLQYMSVTGFLLKCSQLVPPTQIISVALDFRYLIPRGERDRSYPAGCFSAHFLIEKSSFLKCFHSVDTPSNRNQRTWTYKTDRNIIILQRRRRINKNEEHGRNAECFKL